MRRERVEIDEDLEETELDFDIAEDNQLRRRVGNGDLQMPEREICEAFD